MGVITSGLSCMPFISALGREVFSPLYIPRGGLLCEEHFFVGEPESGRRIIGGVRIAGSGKFGGDLYRCDRVR